MQNKKRGMDNKEKIIKELKKNPNGLTVSELSKRLNISRQTVSNCFAFLEGAEKVKIRKVGMAKIYFWVKKRGEK